MKEPIQKGKQPLQIMLDCLCLCVVGKGNPAEEKGGSVCVCVCLGFPKAAAACRVDTHITHYGGNSPSFLAFYSSPSLLFLRRPRLSRREIEAKAPEPDRRV